ncbi:MAG TPA: glycosyltransferase, partial [Acidimicrobiia bacterium]|nr:glycosyltransferase [Acidimicrobiia bacterium]
RVLPGVIDVVVVDHGADGSGEVAARGGARVVSNPTNPGFGTGQNRGVRMTSARYVLLLNPDADPDPTGIAAGVDALDADPTVAAVQGVIANRTTGAPERSQGRELGPVHLVGRALSAGQLLHWGWVRNVSRRVGRLADHVERVPEDPQFVESLAATCVLVRRAAFDDVGGFDESYFLYGEDLDLCRRLRGRGWRLLALPEPFARHDGGASSSTSTERELSWWRGTMRFSALWWSNTAWVLAVAAAATECARICMREPRVSRRAWQALVSEPVRDRKDRRRVVR